MHVHALSALSLVGLATTAAANQLDRRQQAADTDSAACLSNIGALAEASPTIPAALEVVTGDCVPTKLSEVAASFTSDFEAWYTEIVDAISDCPAWPSTASAIPPIPTLAACTGEQPSRDTTATMTSASGNAVATNTDPTRPSTRSPSTAASGTESATTTSARSSAASGSAARSATTSSSQSTNAAARETGVIFAAVAMAAFGAAAL